jgi:hypothetical protein
MWVSAGLEITANYTYSHCPSDQSDISGELYYRAQFLAGFGIVGIYTTGTTVRLVLTSSIR